MLSHTACTEAQPALAIALDDAGVVDTVVSHALRPQVEPGLWRAASAPWVGQKVCDPGRLKQLLFTSQLPTLACGHPQIGQRRGEAIGERLEHDQEVPDGALHPRLAAQFAGHTTTVHSRLQIAEGAGRPSAPCDGF